VFKCAICGALLNIKERDAEAAAKLGGTGLLAPMRCVIHRGVTLPEPTTYEAVKAIRAAAKAVSGDPSCDSVYVDVDGVPYVVDVLAILRDSEPANLARFVHRHDPATGERSK
jgi:hypothetical protein